MSKPKKKKQNCINGCYIEYVGEGDRRLICKKHKNYYVLMNGHPILVEKS